MVLEFLWKYLAGPIIADAKNAETAVWNGVTAHTGYNIYNTITWAVIAVAALLFIRNQFRKRDISITTETAINSIPYILLGGVLRFLEDAAVLPFVLRPLAITPVIYVLLSGLFLLSIIIASRMAQRSSCGRDELLKNLGYVYISPFLALTVKQLLGKISPSLIVVPTVIALGLTGAYYLITRRNDYSSEEYMLVAFSQFFGGSVSMISLSQGYSQKQVLTQSFTSIFGEPGILVLKTLIIGLSVYILEDDIEDELMKPLALIVLYSIGLGTGLRVMLRVAAGL